jgi:hypothetical protein
MPPFPLTGSQSFSVSETTSGFGALETINEHPLNDSTKSVSCHLGVVSWIVLPA